ncbi:MAG: FAD-dependent oxidoreductase [Bacillota bacterium]
MTEPTRIVVIGGVAAGPKAAARARRRDPRARITIVEQGELVSYASCGIPYYIGGQCPELQYLVGSPIGVNRDPEFFKAVKDIEVRVRTRAEHIDRPRKRVQVKDLENGTVDELPYDKLVLATGSVPLRLPVPGSDLEGVHPVWTLPDAVAIRKQLVEERAAQVVIVGGGLIGLELAESLLEPGRDDKRDKPQVRVIEARDQLVPGLLDPEVAALVAKHLRRRGLEVSTGETVRSFEGDRGRVRRVVTDQGVYSADVVAVAIGARPNVTLARDAGLELGPSGAVNVNKYLETSDPDIYAGGDCAQKRHLITEEVLFAAMGSVANRQGRVIGTNLTGGRETFPGVLGTAIFKVFDFSVGRTGLTERQAREAGYPVDTVIVSGADHAHFFPGSQPQVVKLIADRDTGRLLGGQLVGGGNVNKRLDVLAAALSLKGTAEDLAGFDLAYAPPYNTAMDVLHHAANTLRNKLAGEARTLTPESILEHLENGDCVLLDVRTPGEVRKNPPPFPNVIHVPLANLRDRAGELPRDKALVPYCTLSVRAWEAQRILDARGFENARFLEGGLVGWPY